MSALYCDCLHSHCLIVLLPQAILSCRLLPLSTLMHVSQNSGPLPTSFCACFEDKVNSEVVWVAVASGLKCMSQPADQQDRCLGESLLLLQKNKICLCQAQPSPARLEEVLFRWEMDLCCLQVQLTQRCSGADHDNMASSPSSTLHLLFICSLDHDLQLQLPALLQMSMQQVSGDHMAGISGLGTDDCLYHRLNVQSWQKIAPGQHIAWMESDESSGPALRYMSLLPAVACFLQLTHTFCWKTNPTKSAGQA